MTNNVIRMKGASPLPDNAPKTDRSTMDTLVITVPTLDSWKKPPFQRELRLTPRVKAIVRQIRQEEVIEGVFTLGKFEGDLYLIDGQHRGAAFRMACDPEYEVREDPDDGHSALVPHISEALADVRIKHFRSHGEMAAEFVLLNRPLVAMRNDDLMRGLEEINPHIAMIRKRCPFVGYDHIRSGEGSRILLSMATAVRVWLGCAGETPTPGPSSAEAVAMLNEENVAQLCDFLSMCFEAWGRDKEHFKLWTGINLGILSWLWRRVVLQVGLPPYKGGTRVIVLARKEFLNCAMALAADAKYSDWLVGRSLGDRDRSPCYSRVREIFSRRLVLEGTRNPRFPSGSWIS